MSLVCYASLPFLEQVSAKSLGAATNCQFGFYPVKCQTRNQKKQQYSNILTLMKLKSKQFYLYCSLTILDFWERYWYNFKISISKFFETPYNHFWLNNWVQDNYWVRNFIAWKRNMYFLITITISYYYFGISVL